MSPRIAKHLKLYETTQLLGLLARSGTSSEWFSVSTGSRLVFSLYVKAIDPGTTITAKIKNGFTIDEPLEQVLTWTANATGYSKRILTDFHNLFEAEVVVAGGNAEYALAVSVHENSLALDLELAPAMQVTDGDETLQINPDGSINVTLQNSSDPQNVIQVFGSSSSVPAGSETAVASYTVPVGKRAELQRVEFSGENIAVYRLYAGATLIAERHTYFGGDLSGTMEFLGSSEDGPSYPAGTVLSLKVEHGRPTLAPFSARIQALEIG